MPQPVLARDGEAGHSGADVRSDLRVRISPRERGGIELIVVSRVAAYYGPSIEQQVRDVLAQLEVEHAHVAIEDEGALPFTIAARIEAAACRAGLGEHRRALPERIAESPATARDRMRRSRLYLPGSQPRFFINAALHAPDAIILDLEDSVHPAEKDSARLLVRNALRAVEFAACERMVRINQLPLGLADLDQIVPEQPDLILIPKVETADQVLEVDRRITQILEDIGSHRALWLMPIIESALGIENAFAIAVSTPRVCALTLGLEDYTADLGVPKSRTGEESLYARTRVVNAAHAAGLQAIDSVWGDIGDMEGLTEWARRSRALGFEGMGCVHPSQIEVIHAAFAPTQAEIAKAQKIVAAFHDAESQGFAVVSLGSKMIDPPVVKQALRLVERAKAMGLIEQPESTHA